MPNQSKVLLQEVVVHYHSTIAIPRSTSHPASYYPTIAGAVEKIAAHRNPRYRLNSRDVCNLECEWGLWYYHGRPTQQNVLDQD